MILAQLSDTHVTLPGVKLDARTHSATRLGRAVEHLLALPNPPDAVIVTGDLVDRGGAEEYARLKELLRPLRMPVYVVPGNHDEREALRTAFASEHWMPKRGFIQYAIDQFPVRLLALDTNVPGEPGGRLCTERLDWLQGRLSEQPARPSLVFMHHPPYPTGHAVMDGMSLEGAEALAQILLRYHNVELVTSGHVHRATHRRFGGTLAMTCPSTSHQLELTHGEGGGLAVVNEPPSCFVHRWTKETGVVSHASVIGDYGERDVLHDGTGWL